MNVIPAGCLWLLMKIQRVMKMMKIEPENLAAHPKKWAWKKQKSLWKVISVRKTQCEVTSHRAMNLGTKFQTHEFGHL